MASSKPLSLSLFFRHLASLSREFSPPPHPPSAIIPIARQIVLLAALVVAPALQACSLLVLCQGALLAGSAALSLVCICIPLSWGIVPANISRVYRAWTCAWAALALVGWFRPEISAHTGVYASRGSVMVGGLADGAVTMSVASAWGFQGKAMVTVWDKEEENRAVVMREEVVKFERNAAAVAVNGLRTRREYAYKVEFVQENGRKVPEMEVNGAFRTMGKEADTVRFASTSCMQRRLLWGKTFSGFKLMQEKKPEFLLFLGDFIYSDVPRGMGYTGIGYGQRDELYAQEYLAVRNSKYAREFLANTPVFAMYDDHEVLNDFPGRGTDISRFDAAIMRNWYHYVGSVNPINLKAGDAVSRGGFWYNFSAGNADFFMLDTRMNRDEEAGQLLGETQMNALEMWMMNSQKARPGAFRIVISPVTMTRNRPEKHEGWNCCPRDRERVLNFISNRAVQNVVFITGDTHKPGIFELAPGLFEIGISPMDAFGPRPWNGKIDRTVYEGRGMTTAFAIFQLNATHLNVDIYGGGFPVGVQVASVIVVFVGLAFFALANQDSSAMIHAGWFIAAFLVTAMAIWVDDLSEDPAFSSPRFTFSLSAQ